MSGLYSHLVNRTILVEFSLMKNINLTSNRVRYLIIMIANKYELQMFGTTTSYEMFSKNKPFICTTAVDCLRLVFLQTKHIATIADEVFWL